MKNLSKLLVCTALLALVWGQLPQLQARASSCHSHQHSPASNSSPRGHQCCQAGHNSAVPQNGMEFASPVQLARIEPLVMITSGSILASCTGLANSIPFCGTAELCPAWQH